MLTKTTEIDPTTKSRSPIGARKLEVLVQLASILNDEELDGPLIALLFEATRLGYKLQHSPERTMYLLNRGKL